MNSHTSTPAQSLGQVLADQWCQDHGLESPADLRYAFTSWEEAWTQANPEVADAWLELSSMTAADLPSAWAIWHRARKSVPEPSRTGGRPPPVVASRPGSGRGAALRKSLLRRTAVKGGHNPEQTALSRAAQEMLALALEWPQSKYTTAYLGLAQHERPAWQASVLAELESMGPIHTRLGAWRTWSAWCQEQGVVPTLATEPELRRFVYRPAARAADVNAPRSRWDLLNWFRLHLGAPVPTDLLARPPAKRRPGGRRTAVAADPEIFLVSDQALAEMSVDDPLYVFGIANLVLYQATMRCRHCIRSVIQSLGSRLITFACLYGKKRGGWTWQLPRYTPAGVDLGGYLWERYVARVELGGKAPVGIISNPEVPGAIEYVAILAGCRTFLREAAGLEDANQWTTYSARKAIPTILDILEAPDHTRRAAGHWADEETSMPVRYSAARMATSTLARAEAIRAIEVVSARVRGKLSWEALEGARHSFDMAKVKKTVAKLVSDNVQVAGLSASQLAGVAPEAPRFNLSRMARAPKQRAQRPREPEVRLVGDLPPPEEDLDDGDGESARAVQSSLWITKRKPKRNRPRSLQVIPAVPVVASGGSLSAGDPT